MMISQICNKWTQERKFLKISLKLRCCYDVKSAFNAASVAPVLINASISHRAWCVY